MRLSPERFNRFLAHIGQTVEWRRAHACPCINTRSGAANPSCTVCRGKGQFWDDPVVGIAGFAGQKVLMAWAQFGRWEDGDVVLSIPSDSPVYEMGRFDRVLMRDGTTPYSLVLMPGEQPRFPVRTVEQASAMVNGAKVDLPLPTIMPDGSLSWPAGALPDAYVSISGRRSPEYFCYGEYPQDRPFHHGEPLPRRVVLRKFDLFGR